MCLYDSFRNNFLILYKASHLINFFEELYVMSIFCVTSDFFNFFIYLNFRQFPLAFFWAFNLV